MIRFYIRKSSLATLLPESQDSPARGRFGDEKSLFLPDYNILSVDSLFTGWVNGRIDGSQDLLISFQIHSGE